MTQIVPWIGYQLTDRVLADALEEDLGIQVERELQLADEGLKRAMDTAYPLIIVHDVIAPGDLELPLGMPVDAYSEVSCHLIRKIRESGPNKDTPIVAAVLPLGKYVVPQRYLDAGATHVFDKTHAKHPADDFVTVIGQYLSTPAKK